MALPRNLCRVLANTGEVTDNREKKELNMEIRKSEFAGVETIKKKTTLIGLSILMCVVLDSIFVL